MRRVILLAAALASGAVFAASQLTEFQLFGAGGPGTYGQSIIANGGGGGLLVQNNSVYSEAYGIVVATASTGSPAITGRSVAYYGGLFVNVTDSGSVVANANNIGVVGHSRQSNAAYFEQGMWNETLARANPYSALYVTRNAALGGHDYTGAMLHVDDTTPASGNLLTLSKQGADKLTVSKGGVVNFAANTGPHTVGGAPFFYSTGGTQNILYTGSTDLQIHNQADDAVLLKVKNDGKIAIPLSFTPASASAPCEAGTIAFDADYLYRCVAPNTWKRAALSSW